MVETSFTCILNKARVLMTKANVLYLIRHKIIQEGVITATKLDNLRIIIINGVSKTRYEYFGMKLLKFTKYL